MRYPSITNRNVYPYGTPLIAPPINENEPNSATMDDGDTGFAENPNGCWTVSTPAGWAGDHRWRNVPFQNPGNCTATWNFPGTPGRYNVFVYVPNIHATTDAAQYTIRHTESPDRPWSKQSAWAAVNQLAYPNVDHPSSWVYVGTYYFNNQYGTDYVRLESQPLNPVTDAMMAADAVRFAPVRYRVYLPLVMKRWPPIPDTPVLNPINNPNGSSSYTVSWQPAYLASTYTLQEALNADFSTGVVTYYPGSTTSWLVTGKAPRTYYYRVKATNSWGDSGWSNTQQTTVWPSTTTFYAVADAMVLSGYPTTNYGGRADMWAGYDDWLNPDGKVARSLARFDLSAIPAGTPIGRATLWLYLYASYDPKNASRIIAVYRVTSSWTEGGVTWSARPNIEGTYYYGTVSIPHASWRWYSIDVTELVRQWVNGQYSNYGVWILGNESSGDPNWRGFCTRENSSGCKPYLAITYGGGAGASGVQPSAETLFVSPLPTPMVPRALPGTFRSPVLIPEP
ncbi:MAG: DNRLRE domain-containing protein [Anaerolineae bacterium]|nr:DNRLRE domain-containing protein [Anaerolineae bacterium]